MSLYYKDSIMARRDSVSDVKTGYWNDDTIGEITIKDVLLSLTCNNYGFKGMPTRNQLQKALRDIKKVCMTTIEMDFDFYAREVIPKFLEYKKE